eukprot:COSAG01_NODE_5652_length_4115_cov_51.959661_4_plen_105_part_00
MWHIEYHGQRLSSVPRAARAVSQNHDCTLRQHSAADSLLKVPSQRTAVILADPRHELARGDLGILAGVGQYAPKGTPDDPDRPGASEHRPAPQTWALYPPGVGW